jgi:sec-independent protein translocase protein TatA
LENIVGGFGIWHWLIVIILVMLLFGKGRISDMMGDLGKGLKSFKQGMAEEDEQKRPDQTRPLDPRQLPPQQPIDITPQPTPRADAPVAPQPPRDDSAL